MLSWRELRNASLQEVPASLYESPWHLMAILAFAIFFAETAMMALLYLVVPFPQALTHIKDPQFILLVLVPALLILFLFPLLVLFVLRPLRKNIAERKRAEEELQRQKEYFRSLAENSPDIIMRFDRRLRYLYINPAGEQMFGLPAKSLYGKTDRELGIAADTARVWETRISLAFATGRTGVFEIAYPERENAVFEARLVPEATTDGSVPSVLVISRDITARKKAESELRMSREQLRLLSWRLQAAREEERTRIAREIHDELGQVLAALSLETSLLESELSAKQMKLRRKAAAMSRLIASTIQTVQRVSADLRPVMLDDLGLAAAVQWQIGEFQKRTGLACNFQIDLHGQEPDRECATALFRILQEALTNILRHAKATRVSVRLVETEFRFLLQIGDNGRGITRAQIADRHSLGLLGIRERVGFWGGKVRIRGLAGLGTSVKVTLPHPLTTKDKGCLS